MFTFHKKSIYRFLIDNVTTTYVITLDLLKASEWGVSSCRQDILIRHARKNKVLLEFLRAMDIRDGMRKSEEYRYTSVLMVAREVVRALDGLRYSLFKFFRPIVYVPANIDVLVSRSDLVWTVYALLKRGFRIVVLDPYCVTLARNGFIVDLYACPSLAGLALIDDRDLLDHAYRDSINGVEAYTLKYYAEALVVAVHSILKERIFTLNDYITIKSRITGETFELAKETYSTMALEKALELSQNWKEEK